MSRLKNVHVQLTEELFRRAKQAVLDRNLQGGVSALMRDGLELRLADIDKIPVIFEVAFRRVVGREPTNQERYTCYGSRQPHGGLKLYGLGQRHTLQELEEHCMSGRWDERTAALVWEQEQHWLRAGEVIHAALMRPPGWSAVVAAMQPGTPGPRVCEHTGTDCASQAECDFAERCLHPQLGEPDETVE